METQLRGCKVDDCKSALIYLREARLKRPCGLTEQGHALLLCFSLTVVSFKT